MACLQMIVPCAPLQQPPPRPSPSPVQVSLLLKGTTITIQSPKSEPWIHYLILFRIPHTHSFNKGIRAKECAHATPKREKGTGAINRVTSCPGLPGILLFNSESLTSQRTSQFQAKTVGQPGEKGIREHRDGFLEEMTPEEKGAACAKSWKGGTSERVLLKCRV